MKTDAQAGEVEPVGTTERAQEPRPHALHEGLRLRIHGRSIKLRGLRRPPAGVLAWLALLGPGMIAGAAGNDAGGIATYAQIGAKFGYSFLWVMAIVTVSLGVMQETSARLGAATGRGLLDLVRERFGLHWAALAIAIVLIANGGLMVAEFTGVGAALELLGVSKYIAIPVAAVVLAYLVIAGRYQNVEKIFLLMALVFLTYPVAAVLAHPQWGEVAHGLVPSVSGGNYVQMLVALLGSALTPYQQLFQQSSVVEKGVARRHYGGERADAYAGALFAGLMAAAIIIATAATLHASGKLDINTAQEAAQALAPVAGPAAEALFAAGLLGAALLAGAVLPLATAYSVSETFGFAKGVSLDFRRAPLFFGLFVALLVFGAGAAMVPGLPVIQLLIAIQVLNGVLLPVLMLFMLLLANQARLMGDLKNSRWNNILGWGTFAMVSCAVLVLLGTQALALFGIHVLGA